MSQFVVHNVHKCDRCGAEERISPAMNTGYFCQETIHLSGSVSREVKHLCPNCFLAYTAWLNSSENDTLCGEESEV